MNTSNLLYSTRLGSAIPLVLIAVIILSVMGAGLISLGFQSRAYAIRTTSEIAARSAADAGLIKAIYEMNQKLEVKPWSGSTLPATTDEQLLNCDSTFSYTIALNDGAYYIESVGTSGQTQKTVTAALQLNGPFEYAIFTENGIDLKNSAVVDWFNNDADDESLQIGTNSTEPDSIDLKNGVTINGDVVVGPGGQPDIVIRDAGATITGDIYTASETYVLTPVTVPEYLQDMPSQGTISNNATITNSAKYDEINLSNSRIITIDGDVALYIIGDVTLKNSAELRIVDEVTNPDASLTLYLGGDVEVKNSGNINNITADSRKLKMYGLNSCQSMALKNGSDFYGAIYAPNADVQMMNSADVFGAVVAKSFEQNNSATLNYDAALRDVDTDDEIIRFVIKRWSE
ncbi:MAG: DUF7305 domain-containing protein [Planctomycetota bacterium]